MNKKIFGLAILVLALLLSACAADAPAPNATQTEPPALLSTNSQVTYQPTFTITPTQTLRPTSTPYHTPTITPSPTPHPTITLPPYPTPEIGLNFGRWPHAISPSGEWIVWWVDCELNDEYRCLQFINKDATKIWNYSDYYPIEGSESVLIGMVKHWSKDNKFVYLELGPEWMEPVFPITYGIVKFSLVNGASSYIITPDYDDASDTEDPLWYVYGFSNNSQWLVYAVQNGQSLDFTLLDLYSGETDFFSVLAKEEAFFGDIHWSPDDQYFVFSVAENLVDLKMSDDFSVFRIALEDLSIKRIYSHGDKFLYSLIMNEWETNMDWVSNTEIKYYYRGLAGEYGQLILNIATGEIIEIDN